MNILKYYCDNCGKEVKGEGNGIMLVIYPLEKYELDLCDGCCSGLVDCYNWRSKRGSKKKEDA